MDIDDVSSQGHFFSYLTKYKQTLADAKKRDGELPKNRKPPQQLLANFMMSNLSQSLSLTTTGHQLHSSFIPPPYPPSIASCAELQALYIKDLRLGTHHRGSYLLIRALTTPNRMTAIMAIVEDEKGDAILIQLYHQPSETVRPANSIITKGDIFLLKEPFFKVMSDGEYGLRVDHVSDLVRITTHGPHQGLIPKRWRVPASASTASDWKLRGNNEMKRKEYWSAIER
jgi:hypothetical protein